MSCLLSAEDLQRRLAEGSAPPAALVPLFEMRTFEFTNLTTSGTGDITVVLHPALCVVEYTRVRLAVRVHALTMSGAMPQTLVIYAYGALPSDEDPGRDFVDESTSFLRLDITSSTLVPSLLTASGSDPDAYLRFVDRLGRPRRTRRRRQRTPHHRGPPRCLHRRPRGAMSNAMVAEFRFPPLNVPTVIVNRKVGECSGSGKIWGEPYTVNPVGARADPSVTTRIESKPRILRTGDPRVEQDPGLVGPFVSCTSTPYSFHPITHNNRTYNGQIYLPGIKAGPQLCLQVGTYPVVLLVHARGFPGKGAGEYHLTYEDLAKHLNSHGFAVVSISRNLGTPWEEDFGDILEETVFHLFSQHPLRAHFQDKVVLVGHSSGGYEVVKHGSRIRKPANVYFGKASKNLVSVVLFATSLPSLPSDALLKKLSFGVSSFLGLNVTNDSDFDAYGDKNPGQPMKSTVYVYDRIGRIGNGQISLEKDMIMMSGMTNADSISQRTHFFQDVIFCKAYLTAFCHLHVYGNNWHARYFKDQNIPPSLFSTMGHRAGFRVEQSHEDRDQFSLLLFDEPGVEASLVPYSNVSGSITTAIVETFAVDEFSPHATKALKIRWDRRQGQVNRLWITFSTSVSASGYSYLSLRVAQSVTEPKVDRYMAFRINSGSSVSLHAFGSPVRPPVVSPKPQMIGGFQTKTFMVTYLLPLWAFGLDFSKEAIKKITIDLSGNPTNSDARGEFFLDTFALVKGE